jgi:hypothetical protein
MRTDRALVGVCGSAGEERPEPELYVVNDAGLCGREPGGTRRVLPAGDGAATCVYRGGVAGLRPRPPGRSCLRSSTDPTRERRPCTSALPKRSSEPARDRVLDWDDASEGARVDDASEDDALQDHSELVRARGSCVAACARWARALAVAPSTQLDAHCCAITRCGSS